MTTATSTRLNLPVDQAIKLIRREARGRKVYLHAELIGRPAAPLDHYERVRSTGVLLVTAKSLEQFLLNCERCRVAEGPFLVPIHVDGGYVWVG